MVVHPKERECKATERHKWLLNGPIITHNISNANYMFGPYLADVRGKKARKKPSRLDKK